MAEGTVPVTFVQGGACHRPGLGPSLRYPVGFSTVGAFTADARRAAARLRRRYVLVTSRTISGRAEDELRRAAHPPDALVLPVVPGALSRVSGALLSGTARDPLASPARG